MVTIGDRPSMIDDMRRLSVLGDQVSNMIVDGLSTIDDVEQSLVVDDDIQAIVARSMIIFGR